MNNQIVDTWEKLTDELLKIDTTKKIGLSGETFGVSALDIKMDIEQYQYRHKANANICDCLEQFDTVHLTGLGNIGLLASSVSSSCWGNNPYTILYNIIKSIFE